MPETKEKVDRIRKKARRKRKPATRGLVRKGRRMMKRMGSISTPCTTKRAVVIWPTGIPASAASFDETSSSGANMQKASIKTTPGRMRSAGRAGAERLVMASGVTGGAGRVHSESDPEAGISRRGG